MFVGMPGAYSRVELLQGASLGYTLALFANIVQGWQGLLQKPIQSFIIFTGIGL